MANMQRPRPTSWSSNASFGWFTPKDEKCRAEERKAQLMRKAEREAFRDFKREVMGDG